MKTLDLNQMEKLSAGSSCTDLANGLTGAALVIGFASWYTGFGAGLALALSGAAAVTGWACE